MLRTIARLAPLVLVVAGAAADEPELSLSVDRSAVALGQDFTLSVEVVGKVSGTGEPDIDGLGEFRVLSRSSSHSFSLSGTRMRTSTTFTYRVAPTKVGSFQLGPARLRLGDKTYVSQTADLTVTDVPSAPATPPSQTSEPHGQGAAFLVARADTTTAYVNEQITLSIMLYTRTQFLEQPRYGPPSTSGFWVEELEPQLTYRATVDQRRYDVVEIRTALFPTSPGTYTIGSATVEVVLPDRSARDPFGSPFFRSILPSGRKTVLRTKPITVEVVPPPVEEQPPAFGGAVGRFTLHASLDPVDVEQNEPVAVTTVVEGTGNLRVIPEPRWDVPEGFREYPTKAEVSITKEDYRVGGRKVFETVLVPTRPGRFTIPGPTLAFFDPESGGYNEASASGMQLVVSPSTAAEPVVAGGSTARGVTVVGEDIPHIKTSSSGWVRRRSFPPAPGGWPLHAVPLALVLSAMIWRAAAAAQSSSEAARRRRTLRRAVAAIKRGERLLRSEQWREGLAHVSAALDEFLCTRLDVSRAHLTNDRIESELRSRACPDRLVSDVLACRDQCSRARFAPGAKPEQAPQFAESARRIVKRLGALK